MRKSKMVLLFAALAIAVAGAGSGLAADKASIGLNWAIGPQMVMGPFDSKFTNVFELAWKVNDNFAVAVLREDAMFRGEKSYKDDEIILTPAPYVDMKAKRVIEGNVAVTGLRFLANIIPLPFVGDVWGGLDIGTVSFTGVTASETYEDNTIPTSAAFGASVPFNTTATMVGFVGKLRPLEMGSKTVTAAVDITVGMRFVNFADMALFGSQEANTTKNDTVPPLTSTADGIDPINSYNTLILLVGVGLWF